MLAALHGVLPIKPNHGTQRLHVEALGLRLGIDFADVVGNRFLLLFELFDALDERFQLPLREIGARRLRALSLSAVETIQCEAWVFLSAAFCTSLASF